jgi:predicted nucleic acid-binding protein
LRRRQLEAAFSRAIDRVFQGRVLPLDERAAAAAASLGVRRQRQGRPVELRDTLIAGTVISRQATIATHNVRLFEDTGVTVIDPSVA